MRLKPAGLYKGFVVRVDALEGRGSSDGPPLSLGSSPSVLRVSPQAAPSLQNHYGQGQDHLPAACAEEQGTNPANAPEAAKYPAGVAGQALRAPCAAAG